jgi:hypothetical protein
VEGCWTGGGLVGVEGVGEVERDEVDGIDC